VNKQHCLFTVHVLRKNAKFAGEEKMLIIVKVYYFEGFSHSAGDALKLMQNTRIDRQPQQFQT
jgi:hypothetical protein